MNAQVGLTSPGDDRRRRLPPEPAQDLLHPPRRRRSGHGPDRGGRAPARPSCPAIPSIGEGAVSAAPFGSASILPISWVYIALMGAAGLTRATPGRDPQRQLHGARGCPTHYDVLYTRARRPRRPRVHHRLPRLRDAAPAIDGRGHRQAADGLRLPRPDDELPGAGTLMIEPTESESKAELDRLCDALIAIRDEIRADRGGRARPRGQPAQERAAHRGGGRPATTGPTPTRASRPPSRARGCARTSSGRRSAASTTPTATATWSAPARRSRDSRGLIARDTRAAGSPSAHMRCVAAEAASSPRISVVWGLSPNARISEENARRGAG